MKTFELLQRSLRFGNSDPSLLQFLQASRRPDPGVRRANRRILLFKNLGALARQFSAFRELILADQESCKPEIHKRHKRVVAFLNKKLSRAANESLLGIGVMKQFELCDPL